MSKPWTVAEPRVHWKAQGISSPTTNVLAWHRCASSEAVRLAGKRAFEGTSQCGPKALIGIGELIGGPEFEVARRSRRPIGSGPDDVRGFTRPLPRKRARWKLNALVTAANGETDGKANEKIQAIVTQRISDAWKRTGNEPSLDVFFPICREPRGYIDNLLMTGSGATSSRSWLPPTSRQTAPRALSATGVPGLHRGRCGHAAPPPSRPAVIAADEYLSIGYRRAGDHAGRTSLAPGTAAVISRNI